MKAMVRYVSGLIVFAPFRLHMQTKEHSWKASRWVCYRPCMALPRERDHHVVHALLSRPYAAWLLNFTENQPTVSTFVSPTKQCVGQT
jgi:hypothetical protein